MKHTPLIEQHLVDGAKLVDFAGWEMPIQYASVIDEYQAVRSAAGLFDVSHMGRITVSGQRSLAFLQRMTTNNVSALAPGQAHYSMVCNESGGIKDDIFVYRTGDTEYLLCVNASNREKILAWLLEHRTADDRCQIEDRTAALAQIAIQGPFSRDILVAAGAEDELHVPAGQAVDLWKCLLREGAGKGLKPAGLGARDLLRLEMAYLLYGNDIGEETTPIEAGAAWTVNFEKGDFLGRAPLQRQTQQGPSRRLVAFELLQKSVPRHGFRILDPVSSQPIGEVTSGNLSPLLQKGIGLGYVPTAFAKPDTACSVDIRGKILPAVTVKPPFYRKARTAHH